MCSLLGGLANLAFYPLVAALRSRRPLISFYLEHRHAGAQVGPAAHRLAGVEAEAVDGQFAQYFGVKQGVLVRSIVKGSAAEKAGLKAGDVIVEAGQDQVSKPEDVAKSVEKVKKSDRKAVLLRVEDGKGDLRFVAVPLQ